MRIGVRSAISALVLTSIVVSAIVVHLLWWRTANQVSQTLADTINDQIVAAVGDQLQSITTEARSASIAVRALLTEKVLDIHDAKIGRRPAFCQRRSIVCVTRRNMPRSRVWLLCRRASSSSACRTRRLCASGPMAKSSVWPGVTFGE